jgi:hypothetical protein
MPPPPTAVIRLKIYIAEYKINYKIEISHTEGGRVFR